MLRSLPLAAASLALLVIPAPTHANDIVDFFRAMSGQSAYQPAPVPQIPPQHADIYRPHYDGYHPTPRATHQQSIRRSSARQFGPGNSGFTVSWGNPSVPVIPPPAPVAPVPPHQIGDIVTCPVTLATHVVVKDADEIAPGAVSCVVAVRDPHLGRYRSRGCVEKLAYVEICVPPCPLQRLRVSPCRTKVRLDYGRYEVDIVSRNGCIEVEYDN